MISDGSPASVRMGPVAMARDGDRRERTAWVRRPPGEGRFPTSGTAHDGGSLGSCFNLFPCHGQTTKRKKTPSHWSIELPANPPTSGKGLLH
ncbi:hypothetical protein BHE74_00006133 [Ensete ventricosum]|uniref:Uncharacterized protein n=1 Tax=Ensete ventricosum TaxID=4639 RepID=A0A445M8D7_ENSVE|nr:hypothetical protein BHE74_00006133 [Ensete ventricosum]RZR70497.1 hypothetical protein BHM03_00000314 [Ensete ventricosum]